jgi:ubiquinone/menaquinone biosynthesis C-methylase UbiE
MDLTEEALAYAAADFTAVNEAYVDRVIELAGSRETARVLDLGTGPADIPIRMAQRQPGWVITALDGAPAMLQLAETRVQRAGLDSRIVLVQGDAKSLPFASESFEIICSNSILHHVAEPVTFWSEIKRVASAGALLCLRDLMRPDSEAQARTLVIQHAGQESSLLQEEFYRSLLAAYTLDEVAMQLLAAGLKNLTVAAISDRHLEVFGNLA